MDEYVLVQGKRLRKGYTTGTCATMAAYGATRMLITGEVQETGTIVLPQGQQVTLPLENPQIGEGEARVGVVKDGGDDPDVTSGLTIYARARWSDSPGVQIIGGPGVGQVTRKGLQVPVGEAAINPVPRQMITQAVEALLLDGQGVEIQISVPGGEVVGQKTFNPQLGIVGGISILGTTGIVEPMSEDAYRVSLAIKVKQLAEDGETFGVLVPGNYGKQIATQEYGIAERDLIKTSNFIGYMLDVCVDQGLRRILIIGHLGKLIKVAGGIFHTHSRIADARQEIMAGYAARFGADRELIEEIFESGTTDEMVEILERAELEGIYPWIAERVAERCQRYVRDEIEVGVVLFTFDKGVLAESGKVLEWVCKGVLSRE